MALTAQYGTNLTFDSLAASLAYVYDLNYDHVFGAIANQFERHNQITQSMMSDLVEPTSETLLSYGGTSTAVIEELDEVGRPAPQKLTTGAFVGLPLRKFGGANQWTEEALSVMTGAEIALQAQALMDADILNRQSQIKRAVFRSSDYNFIDYHGNPKVQIPLPVKVLLNADGSPIPPGPNGEFFDGTTHTHYLATASFIEANLASLLTTVIEHYNGTGQAMIYINKAQEATVRGFSSSGNFTPYVPINIHQASTTTFAVGRTLDTNNTNNRAIGLYSGAEVWVKPWIPASYVFCFFKGAPKPLAMRSSNLPGRSNGLTLKWESRAYPFTAKVYDQYFGIAAWNRQNAAVLYTGGGSYVVPVV